MDRDLIAHLDSRFDRFASHIDAKFDAVEAEIRENRKQILENRAGIRENRKQILENQAGIRENQKQIRKGAKKIDETQVMVEDLRSKIQLVAEGHSMLSDKLDRVVEETTIKRRRDRDELRSAFVALRSSLA